MTLELFSVLSPGQEAEHKSGDNQPEEASLEFVRRMEVSAEGGGVGWAESESVGGRVGCPAQRALGELCTAPARVFTEENPPSVVQQASPHSHNAGRPSLAGNAR